MKGTRKAGLLNGFFMMDINGDNVLDKAELAAPQADDVNRFFMDMVTAADGNGDSTVSLVEASNYIATQVDDRSTTRSVAAAYEQLLALDPNKDGKLTAAELENLAVESFAKVDKDGDGVISKAERTAMASAATMAARQNPETSIDPRCAFPKVEDDQKLYVVTAYEGGTLSNTTVAGQDEETETSVIDIAEGRDPIYLAVSSYTPMIWRLTGHTERVARFFGSARQGVGVVGLPKDRVTLVGDRECIKRVENASLKWSKDESLSFSTDCRKVSPRAIHPATSACRMISSNETAEAPPLSWRCAPSHSHWMGCHRKTSARRSNLP